MKLNVIEVRNYLSHPDSRFELNGTRLAAIVGANGAGKSAMLEALRYVLFDDARAKTDQLVRLGQTEMSASIEFEFAGATYRAVRGRSTRGAGKTYLELHVQAVDGSWTPLTGDDIRDTQARIGELLGVDADTFATAVYLGQGEADRFAAATAGERKRILGQVLGLEVYTRAEQRAREEMRTLEATTSMDRASVERLEDAIAELVGAPELVRTRQAEIHEVAGQQTAGAAERDRIQARLTELAGEIAKGDAAAAEVARLEEERTALGERYRREKTTALDADTVAAAAAVTLTALPFVVAALEELPVAQGVVASLERQEAEDRRLADDITPKRRAVDALEREYSTARAGWTSSATAARDLVQSLEAQGKALEPVICEKCQHPNIVDQADIRGQLQAARSRVKALEADEPHEPLSLARDRAAVARLEDRRRDLAWDPAPLQAARARQRELEGLAARQEAMAAAEASRTAAVTAKADAEAELASIDTLGKALRIRIEEAKARTAGVDLLLAEQADLQAGLTGLGESMRHLEGRRRELDRLLATAEANVARLEELSAERDGVAARLGEADVDLARLRRLVAAFGVTGIPARIIEGVLPELTGYANELLGELRPGMVLEIRAQRAKRDGKGVVEALDLIVCDDVGERGLALFSGGERMSVSLAIATALSRLVARRAGAAIRTLVIDEPDGLDADARRSFGQALRVLAHHGELERVVLVSHHPDLAEFGDAVYQVTKSATGSVVEQVA